MHSLVEHKKIYINETGKFFERIKPNQDLDIKTVYNCVLKKIS